MSNGVLMAHTDTTVVSEAVVRKEQAPAFTSSWHPFPHGDVIDAVGAACKKHGWEVERKTYSLKPNEKMFGVWDLKTMNNSIVKTSENTLSIGIRNSVNKALSVGLCAGERVFVCDNLCFKGDFVLFRKHTGLLTREELFVMADEALLTLSTRYEALLSWHESLKDYKLSDANAMLLAGACMRKQYPLIDPSKFMSFYDLYFEQRPRYSQTLHGFHGAITEMFQQHPMFYMLRRNERLVHFIDYEAKMLCAKASSVTVDFVAIEDAAKEKHAEQKEKEVKNVRVAQSEVRERVKTRLKEEKQQQKSDAKAAKQQEQQKQRKQKSEKKPAAKKESAPVVIEEQHEPKPKKMRRTTRVKVREQVAAEAKPIKTKTVKAPKGEKVTTAKRAAAKANTLDDDDILFCDKCSGEFKPSELDSNRLCAKCRSKK